jgi:hypothetical protein
MEVASAQVTVSAHHAAQHSQDQAPGQIGGIGRQHIGGVGHDDLVALGRCQVDVVDTNSAVGDHLQSVRSGQDPIGNRVDQQSQKTVEPGNQPAQPFFSQAFTVVHLDLAMLSQLRRTFTRQITQNQYPFHGFLGSSEIAGPAQGA